MSDSQSLLGIVRPQIFSIQDNFFDGRAGRTAAFAKFIRFSVFAGYTLGIATAGFAERKENLTEHDVLKLVMDVHTMFSANHADIDVCRHFWWQEPTFRFGLDVGSADYKRYMAEQARTGKSEYVLLVALVRLLFDHLDSDCETLTDNLEVFCQTHGIHLRSTDILNDVVDDWGYLRKDVR
jgi:hypothetical protein